MLAAVLALSGGQTSLLVAIGALAGLLGGMLGIGGGLVMIPALLLLLGADAFGVGSLHVYKQAALAAAVVLSIPAAIRHCRARAVNFRLLPAIVLCACGGALGGVWLGSLFAAETTHVLRRIFGGFMIVSVMVDMAQGRRRSLAEGSDIDADKPPPRPNSLACGALVGAPAGLISGLLGVGGGIWAVPAQHALFHIPLRNAIGASTAMIVALAPLAAWMQSVAVSRMPGLNVTDGWRLAAILAPGAAVGGWIGGRLTHVTPLASLKIVFQVLLVVAGLKLALF